VVDPDDMTYIVQRKDRFYVVAYDGLDPLTGKERRRWHPIGSESVSQMFDRLVHRTDVPRIRFHDLRHTHASLLVAAGVPIKVVSERLGHTHPAFTMHTYQHLLPGMSAAAAEQFAALIDTEGR